MDNDREREENKNNKNKNLGRKDLSPCCKMARIAKLKGRRATNRKKGKGKREETLWKGIVKLEGCCAARRVQRTMTQYDATRRIIADVIVNLWAKTSLLHACEEAECLGIVATCKEKRLLRYLLL